MDIETINPSESHGVATLPRNKKARLCRARDKPGLLPLDAIHRRAFSPE